MDKHQSTYEEALIENVACCYLTFAHCGMVSELCSLLFVDQVLNTSAARLLKMDLLMVLVELRRQDECSLAKQVLFFFAKFLTRRALLNTTFRSRPHSPRLNCVTAGLLQPVRYNQFIGWIPI